MEFKGTYMPMIYDVFPLDASPARAEIISALMRRIAATDNVFADYTGTCEAECVALELPLDAMCRACLARMGIIASTLTANDSRVWEVWRTDDADPQPVGVISFTDIQAGVDAKAHYIFFDQRLKDKTPIMEEIIEWAFADHEDWRALERLTIEIPKPFGALARHASRKLGFGGDFYYKLRDVMHEGKRTPELLRVEGVKRGAVKWRGAPCDLLVLGLMREDAARKEPSRTQMTLAPTEEVRSVA